MSAVPSDAPDFPSEEEQHHLQRRLFTYSVGALKAAQQMDRIFVRYPAFVDIVNACDRCFHLARELDVPNGVLVIGPTGTGKSSVINYFLKTIPPSTLFETGFGALAVRLQQRPSVGQVVSAILRKLHYPFADVSPRSVYIKRDIAFSLLREKRCRMIFVDEAYYLLQQMRHRSRDGLDTAVSELLRDLMDDLGIGLVLMAAGPLDFLERVDPALASRVSVRHSLCNFSLDPVWYGFVTAFCKECTAIDGKFLTELAIMKHLLFASGGNQRSFKRLATEAALIAVDAGRTQLDQPTLALAFDRVYGKDHGRLNPFVNA